LSSLKEMSDHLADSRVSPEETASAASEEYEELHRAGEGETGGGVGWGAPFQSAWAGERVCRRCKATSTWRSTGLD